LRERLGKITYLRSIRVFRERPFLRAYKRWRNSTTRKPYFDQLSYRSKIREIIGFGTQDKTFNEDDWVNLPGPLQWWANFPDEMLSYSNELFRIGSHLPTRQDYERALDMVLKDYSDKIPRLYESVYPLRGSGVHSRGNLLVNEPGDSQFLEELAITQLSEQQAVDKQFEEMDLDSGEEDGEPMDLD
jgi:hypothetical protein